MIKKELSGNLVHTKITDAKLQFWIKHNLNVLFQGKHGVGKTSIIRNAFESAGLKFRYFSAATMDPWVDFIGIPKTVEENGHEYLKLVRPLEFEEDNVDAIFIDEFNRAPKKVRNACLELIQFKSINNRKFRNLRIVWAAINPDYEKTYDVDPLDPAQKDRFEVFVNVPYECDSNYFTQKYGINVSKPAIDWWNNLSQEDKDEISPRRLDYALAHWQRNGEIRDILPYTCNIEKLIKDLRTGPVDIILNKMYNENNTEAAIAFLNPQNNFDIALKFLINENNKNKLHWFLLLLSSERLSFLISKYELLCNHIINHIDQVEKFKSIINNIIKTSSSVLLVNKIKNKLAKRNNNELDNTNSDDVVNDVFVSDHWKIGSKSRQLNSSWLTFLRDTQKGLTKYTSTTYDRNLIFQNIVCFFPTRNLTQEELDETFITLETLACKCHSNTLIRFEGFIELFNKCVQMYKTYYSDFSTSILTDRRFANLIRKIKNTGHRTKFDIALETCFQTV